MLVVTLSVVLIPRPQGGGGGGNNNSPAVISAETLNTYAFGAYTAGILSQETGGGTTAEETNLSESQVDLMGECLPIINSLTSSAPAVKEEKSDKSEYAKKLTVTQGAHAYVIYYNESAAKQSDGEVTSSITGKIVIDDVEYDLSGKREKEMDGGDSEYEITVTVYYDDNDYTVFEQEIENEGNESSLSYKYSIYKNGELAENFEVELENEYGNTSVRVETLKYGEMIAFEYTVNEGKGYSVVVEFDEESSATVVVTEYENYYLLTYNGGMTKTFPKK